MTTTTHTVDPVGARTFPIRLAPMQGEALDSWLEATGHRMGAAWGDILHATGLPSQIQSGTATWLSRLTHTQSTVLSQATGQDRATVEDMTLARYDGVALRIHTSSAAVSRAFPWTRRRFSRFCPHCLRQTQGRWQLSWRLGWAFACPTHRCLLADHCPVCRQRQRQRPTPIDLIPHPGSCTAPSTDIAGRAQPRCAADLTTATTHTFPIDHPVLVSQRIINDAIDEGTATFGIYRDHPATTAQALTDIRAVAGRVLAYASPDHLKDAIPIDLHTAYTRESTDPTEHNNRSRSGRKPGLAAPAEALTAAVGVTAAIRILNTATIEEAGNNMRWLITTARASGLTVSATSIGWAKDTTQLLTAAQLSALAPLLKPSDQLRYRTGTVLPQRPSHDDNTIDSLVTKLPTLLWPAWALQLAPPTLAHQHAAGALACATLLVNTNLTLTQAAEQMNWRPGGHALSHVLQKLCAHPNWKDLRHAIIRLAEYLPTHDIPIDYRRRRTLNYDGLLPQDRWERICRIAGLPAGAPLIAAAARSHLYSAISTNPAHSAPPSIKTDTFASAVADFPAHTNARLTDALETEAQTFLQHNNINEPTTWYPPLALLDGLTLPQRDPRDIDIRRLHEQPRTPRTINESARHLDVSPDALRYALTLHPRPSQPAVATAGATASRAGIMRKLPAHRLSELYCEQRISLRAIGARYGVSRQTVARLARIYGIDLRQAHRPREHEEVSRDWLHTEYTLKRRSLPELAAEKGTSIGTMANWARKHGIERRGRGGPSQTASLRAASTARSAPKILQPTLAGIGGAERLSRFTAVSGYHTLSIAAQELGIPQFTLVNQIGRLERELGGKLIERAERGRPMKLTDLGARVRSTFKAWERTTAPPAQVQ